MSIPAALAALCIAAYAGLLTFGRWQLDEYEIFSDLHTGSFVWRRLAYSPRPFSEGLLFLYGEAVQRFNRPLITSFLAVMWIGTLLAAVIAARSALPPARGRSVAAAALALTPFAFLLSTTSITEVFYWPAAAAAYLPTIGAAVVLLFLLSPPLTPKRRAAAAAALVVAATSSEMGAALAVAFAGCALLAHAPGMLTRRQTITSGIREGLWWIAPALIGAAVLLVAISVRFSSYERGDDPHPYAGHLADSLGAAVREFVVELGTLGGHAQSLGIAGALACRLVLCVGVAAVWRQADRQGPLLNQWHASLLCSLSAACLFTIAAAYDHFGILCCERHATSRSVFIDLVVIIAGAALFHHWQRTLPGWLRKPWLPAVLLAASLFPMTVQVTALRAGYENRHWAVSARAQTWESGKASRTDWMQFHISPDGPDLPVHGTGLPLGLNVTGLGSARLARAMGRYFDKASITVCQPWQDDRSWVINGTFIPACPSGPLLTGPASDNAPDARTRTP